MLCFVVVMQSFIKNSHEVFIHIHQDCFAGTGAIVRLPQCQWSKPDGHGKISQCINTTKHSKAKTVCIFLGIYCNYHSVALTGLTYYSWPWWRHKMETFSALLAFCEGNPSVTGGSPSHRPITRALVISLICNIEKVNQYSGTNLQQGLHIIMLSLSRHFCCLKHVCFGPIWWYK